MPAPGVAACRGHVATVANGRSTLKLLRQLARPACAHAANSPDCPIAPAGRWHRPELRGRNCRSLFLGLYACLVLRIFFRDRSAYAQAARRIVSCAFRSFVGFMSMVGVLRWSVQGLDHWQRDRGCLVVANHPTLIDIIFLLAFFEGADCVVKASVLRNPTWKLLVRAADYVSNEDVGVLLAEAARRLQAGRTVVIFPEGTRTVPGEPLSFGAAAGAIAVRAGCECLPVLITCTPPTLYKSLPGIGCRRRGWFRLCVPR
jgi:1-acyl-sn-glycerol-3-phosphate acyltransferase